MGLCLDVDIGTLSPTASASLEVGAPLAPRGIWGCGRWQWVSCRADMQIWRNQSPFLLLAGATLDLPVLSQQLWPEQLSPDWLASRNVCQEATVMLQCLHDSALRRHTRAPSCRRTFSRCCTAFILGGQAEFPVAGPVPGSGPATSAPGIMCPGWGNITADLLPHLSG